MIVDTMNNFLVIKYDIVEYKTRSRIIYFSI